MTPLDRTVLESVSDRLRKLMPLARDIGTEFKMILPAQVKSGLMKKAPHYIAAFSEAKGPYMANVGFMLQQMDLYFSANGIGSCWVGIPKPVRKVIESSSLEFKILMQFGKASETLHRTNASEFRRKSLSEITDIKDADELLEAARLAPSAVNRQNWYFTGDKNLINAYSLTPNFFGNLVGGKYSLINVGVAICHLQIAAEHFGKTTAITFEEKRENPRKGLEYVASLKIEA